MLLQCHLTPVVKALSCFLESQIPPKSGSHVLEIKDEKKRKVPAILIAISRY